jgi:hypothetical protein
MGGKQPKREVDTHVGARVDPSLVREPSDSARRKVADNIRLPGLDPQPVFCRVDCASSDCPHDCDCNCDHDCDCNCDHDCDCNCDHDIERTPGMGDRMGRVGSLMRTRFGDIERILGRILRR